MLHTNIISDAQVPHDEEVEILPLDAIVADNYDDDETEGEILAEAFWNKYPRFAKSVTNNYLNAVEQGWTTPETAVKDLVAFGLLPYPVIIDMLGTHLRSLQVGEAA